MGFAAPIGEALGLDSEEVGENVRDGLVVILGRAGVVLRHSLVMEKDRLALMMTMAKMS